MSRIFWRLLGARLDTHHTFVVHYKIGNDHGLDMHTDDSDITFNICLGKEFEGGDLDFCGILGAPNHRKYVDRVPHKKGVCLFHLGRKRHGASDITKGERLNLIIWNKNRIYRASQSYRNDISQKHYQKEDGPPDKLCLSYTHDKDYKRFHGPDDLPKNIDSMRPWCPPNHAWYNGASDDQE